MHPATQPYRIGPTPSFTTQQPVAAAPPEFYTKTMPEGRRTPQYDATEACRFLAAAEPKLATLIVRAGPYTLKLHSQHSPFDTLLEAIIGQQVHAAAARAILHRLLQLFGAIHPTPQLLLQQPDAALRAAGLSNNKMLAIQDLARKTIDGTVPELKQIRKMADDEIVQRLSAVRGIGVWTAQMLLMFRLGRPDVFPITDYGVRKGYALTFNRLPKTRPFDATMLADPRLMLRRAQKWQPWRSVAAWYLWRACDLAAKPATNPSAPPA
jgi:DNA-3-methyladenine glycosylase II